MSIETNMLVLDQFRCQMPILYFGQYLDCLIPSEKPKWDGNVTKEAIEFLKQKQQKKWM